TTTTTAEPTTTTTGKDGATDPNRRDVDIHMNSDNPDFVEKLKAAAVGEAVVVEYKKDDGYGETLPYAGVLLRLDPAADRGEKDGEPINYYEESRRSIIYGARNEEFEEDLKKWIDPCKDKAEINLTVQQQCNPKKLFA
ncbi:MAG: hypothetical protein FWE80_07040, partial [Oscillospiraceae bacterium]|nr:hypothetical protein [Oscillospiraceae bacterium]